MSTTAIDPRPRRALDRMGEQSARRPIPRTSDAADARAGAMDARVVRARAAHRAPCADASAGRPKRSRGRCARKRSARGTRGSDARWRRCDARRAVNAREGCTCTAARDVGRRRSRTARSRRRGGGGGGGAVELARARATRARGGRRARLGWVLRVGEGLVRTVGEGGDGG